MEDYEQFMVWLCTKHDTAVVGEAGMCFHSPLASWLSELTRHVYGSDDVMYGRACWDYRAWKPLSRWAVLFSNALNSRYCGPVRALDAFTVLAYVERVLSGWKGFPSYG